MKLLLIHGAPASGKLTVAKAVVRAVPGRLFDNHAAMDVALTVFDFGAPGFWKLVHAVRLSVLDAAAEQDAPLVVATYCYAEPEDRPALEQFEQIVQRHNGELLPVFLKCSREELLRRIGNADRAERGKITSQQGFDRFVGQYNLAPVPRSNCLVVDSEANSPDSAAQQIIRHFDL
jgi:adenylylsulfate kinase-like enzyme